MTPKEEQKHTDLRDKVAASMAIEFVREQSCGEWDDKTIKADADKLAKLMLEFTSMVIAGAMA